MKKSEKSQLIQEYRTLQAQLVKKRDTRIAERLKEIEHRYYHETGNDLKSSL
ncbi:MAG: hypothetical protein ACT4OD_01725 [Candidatus Nitrosotenuis sp.]